MPLAKKAVARRVQGVDPRLERLGETRLARSPGAQDAAHDDRLVAVVRHPLPEVGQDGTLEHVGHLVGDAGHGVDHLVADRADEARRGAARLGDDRRPRRYVGLARVVGRHLAPACLEEGGDGRHHLLVALEGHVHDLGDGVARDVVLGGPEAPADDHAVGARQRGAQRAHDPGVIVADGLVEVRVHARRGHLLAEPHRVGVGDLAEQQLRADGDDLDPHAARPCRARRPSK
jgi:hypothetical protein